MVVVYHVSFARPFNRLVSVSGLYTYMPALFGSLYIVVFFEAGTQPNNCFNKIIVLFSMTVIQRNTVPQGIINSVKNIGTCIFI